MSSRAKIWINVPVTVSNQKLFEYFNAFGELTTFKLDSKDSKKKVVKLVYEDEEDCEKVSHSVHNVCVFDDVYRCQVVKRSGKKYGRFKSIFFGSSEKKKQEQKKTQKPETEPAAQVEYPLAYM
ncbi:RRM domain-containing protein [Entamoeba marina]